MSTGEGLINEVRDPVEDEEGEEIDPGVADKRLLVYESEFAQPLVAMQRQGNTLEPIVRPAWDGTVLRTLVKNSPLMATGAHISILGNITQEELEIALSQSSLFNGFANRWGQRLAYIPENSANQPSGLAGLLGTVALGKRVAFDSVRNMLAWEPKEP